MNRNGLVGLALAAALIGSTGAQAASKSALVKRGSYLVNTIMTCGNCHTPPGPKGPIMAKAFSGGLSWDEPPFKVTAPNITQDKETGIGKWADADIKKLLRKGVRPNGTPIAPIMPTGFYGIITDHDMDAIVAYLRTLKPIKNKVPEPVYRFPAPRQIFPGAEKPYTEAMFKNNPVKHGFYLATIGHCMECHTPMVKGQHPWDKMGTGGMKFPGPWGVSVSANVTEDKAKGIGKWTNADIRRAITTGIAKDGHHLKPPMGFGYYAKMKRSDISDIIAWLRTLPANE
ncbi:MAG TPA: c-type cytochrome [Pseudolabrys sp.]|nr:c-type cytochrome [Pseudolabrys sp.]